MFKIKDKVQLPFGEEGVVKKIRDYVWITWYDVKITKGSVFNKKGDICDFKESQMTFV